MSKIGDYITSIKDEEARSAIFNQVIAERVIKEALDTPVGNALFTSIIDTITDKTKAIIGYCTADTVDKQTEKIRKTALEIHVAFNLMKDWADIIVNGEHHEERMEKK